MREIKFRAWDKENNFMFYSVNNYPISKYDLGFDFMGKNEFRLMILTDVEESLFKKVDANIMQYICKKDESEKAIYEGDIVKIGDAICKVIFENFSFYCEGIDKEFNDEKALLFEIDKDDYEIKVIGNIYENTEMLVRFS